MTTTTIRKPHPVKGDSSPWGSIHHVTEVAEGIIEVSTASHGGIKLNRQLNAQVPEYMRRKGGWYEEDCEWCLPAVALKLDETISRYEGAKNTMKHWFADEYEKFFNVVLQPGESRDKDDRMWHEAHKNDWIVDAAKTAPDNMVIVTATQGGSRVPVKTDKGWEYPPEKEFLVSKEEYDARNPLGFVINPEKHQEVPAGTWHKTPIL